MGREKLLSSLTKTIPGAKKIIPSSKTKVRKVKTGEKTLVPLKFVIPDTIITRFATNMTVQILEEEFKVCFYEMKPALVFDRNEKPPPEILAHCVASVVLTPDRVSRLIKSLQDQLDQYHNSRHDETKE